MSLSLKDIPFNEFLDGTIQIAITCIILAIIIIILLSVKPVDKLISKLNTKVVTKDSPKFKVVYILLSVAIAIALTTIIYASVRDYQTEPDFMFYIFALLTFFLFPISLGIVASMTYSIAQGKIQWGNTLLLLLFFSIMAYFGSNIHDLLWCFDATEGLQVKNLGGADMEPFFVLFGITDKLLWDYRIFFFYVGIIILIELLASSLIFVKIVKFSKQEYNKFNSLASSLIFLLIFASGLILGIFIYILDAPFNYTMLSIRLSVLIGIPLIALIYSLAGFILSKFTTPKTVKPTEKPNSEQ
ncbi:MAG: hypothetical protein FK733_09400 [Asgard group archaeon]|nr:hypothetical protein [Asgard group archaeon]